MFPLMKADEGVSFRHAVRGDPVFDAWLDGRLRAIYRSVLDESIPDDILDALKIPHEGTEQ